MEEKKPFDFDEQLSIGERGENLFIQYGNYRLNKGKIKNLLDVRNDPAYQRRDIDFVMIGMDGKETTVEVKTDTLDTGNIFMETNVHSFHFGPDGNVEKTSDKAGWLFGCQADYVFYWFEKANVAYLFDLKKTRYWVCNGLTFNAGEKNLSKVRSAKNKNNDAGNSDEYFGFGFALPLNVFEKHKKETGLVVVKF